MSGESEPAAISYVFWEEEGTWLGYLEAFPDYWTQGSSHEDLEEHLRDLHHDLSSGDIPNVWQVARLQLR